MGNVSWSFPIEFDKGTSLQWEVGSAPERSRRQAAVRDTRGSVSESTGAAFDLRKFIVLPQLADGVAPFDVFVAPPGAFCARKHNLSVT